jgi:hypothetical protein
MNSRVAAGGLSSLEMSGEDSPTLWAGSRFDDSESDICQEAHGRHSIINSEF